MVSKQKKSSKQETIVELTDILDQDIETIVALRMNAERKVNRHQRMIEKATGQLGRPLAVYLILLLIVTWVGVNVFHTLLGIPAFDLPPFPWLQDLISLSALVMTVLVLTTQNRQAKLAEQRRHMDLQINLLTERKVSKVIEMLENLRRDIPLVQIIHDSEAEAMKEPIDPSTALTALNQTLKEAAREYELEIE